MAGRWGSLFSFIVSTLLTLPAIDFVSYNFFLTLSNQEAFTCISIPWQLTSSQLEMRLSNTRATLRQELTIMLLHFPVTWTNQKWNYNESWIYACCITESVIEVEGYSMHFSNKRLSLNWRTMVEILRIWTVFKYVKMKRMFTGPHSFLPNWIWMVRMPQTC